MKKNKIKNGVLSVLTLVAIVAVFVIIEKTSSVSDPEKTGLSLQEVVVYGDRNPEPEIIQTSDMENKEADNLDPNSKAEEAEEAEEAENNNPAYSESDYKRAEQYVSDNWLPDNTINQEAYIAVGGTHMDYWNKLNNQLPTNVVDEDKENNSDQGLLE